MKKQHCFSLPGLSFLQTGLKWRKHSIWELNWESSPTARETFPWAFSFSAQQLCTELPAATPRQKLQVQCISYTNSCSSAPQGRDRPQHPSYPGFHSLCCGSTGRCRGPGRRAARQTCSVCRCCCTGTGEETPPHRSGFHLTTSSGHSSQHQNPSGQIKKKKIKSPSLLAAR